MISKRTKSLSLCSVLTALSVVILLLGALFDVLDLTAAMFASMLTVIAVIECGKFWPWLVFSVTAVLSVILLPYKLPAVFYIFAGYYPIVKEKFEKLRRPFSWTLKFALFNASLTVAVLICRVFFPQVDFSLIPGVGGVWIYVVLYLLGNFTFVLYDVLLTKLITLYLLKLRKLFRLKR